MIEWPHELSELALNKEANEYRIDTTAQKLGEVLKSGSLALFIGSGVSTAVGLPLWSDLNKKIVKKSPRILHKEFPDLWSKIKDQLPKTGELRKAGVEPLKLLDQIEQVCSLCDSMKEDHAGDKHKFIGTSQSWHYLVRQALYGEDSTYSFEDMFFPELVSLCSLLIGGRRGRAREVITFNYDDLLENFLKLHGQLYEVVTPLPNKISPNHATIFYHPHGYLPRKSNHFLGRSFLLLSRQSYEQKSPGLKYHRETWQKFIGWMLCVRVGLFVGISGNDRILERYFDEAYSLWNEQESRRPLAFVILVGHGYLPPKDWLSKRIVPLEFSSATDVARFLTLTCQKAAELS